MRASLERFFPGSKPTFVLGILRDKNWAVMCERLAPLAGRILLAPVGSERTASPDELRNACVAANPAVPSVSCHSLADALSLARKESFLVVTGSLHFVGEAMEMLGLLPASMGERDLNEWDAGAVGAAKGQLLGEHGQA